MAAKSKTHYEVLEISKNAKLIDIKKAYRRLALKHHPDRNGGSTESTERFKEISEAYTVLSSPSSRSDYDLALKFPSSVSPAAATSSNAQQSYQGVSDPFRQFNDLFRNDPFFHEAFQDMDDAFSKRFDNSNDEHRDEISSVADRWPILGCGTKKAQKAEKKNVPWTKWLMDKLGIELEVSSFSHGADGSVTSSNYSSKATGTLNKQTKTYVENGRQVTVMSLEKNGNSIEDKFVGGELVERRVNGKLEAISQVAAN